MRDQASGNLSRVGTAQAGLNMVGNGGNHPGKRAVGGKKGEVVAQRERASSDASSGLITPDLEVQWLSHDDDDSEWGSSPEQSILPSEKMRNKARQLPSSRRHPPRVQRKERQRGEGRDGEGVRGGTEGEGRGEGLRDSGRGVILEGFGGSSLRARLPLDYISRVEEPSGGLMGRGAPGGEHGAVKTRG